MTHLELGVTAHEPHMGALLTALPAGDDRVEDLPRRVERIERRLDLADPAQGGDAPGARRRESVPGGRAQTP